MAFKSLNDGQRRAALLPFLRAADRVAGVSVTFAIDKNIGNLFPLSIPGFNERRDKDIPLWTEWPFEKLMRATNLIGFFLALVSKSRQDVLWVSDQDEIAGNFQQYWNLSRVLAQVSSHYLCHDLGHLKAGTTAYDSPLNRNMEDLCSIPDLVAGAISEVLTTGQQPSAILTKLPSETQPKSAYIAQWLSLASPNLSKLVCYARAADGDKINYGWLHFKNGPDEQSMVVPDSFHVEAIRWK